MKVIPSGIIFEKRDNFVVVFKDNSGRQIKFENCFPENHSYPSPSYRLIGIFKKENKKRIFYTESQHQRKKNILNLGSPEYEAAGKAHFGSFERRAYFRKLKKILEKMKEFMSLGIDKNSAYKAAVKCCCHVH